MSPTELLARALVEQHPVDAARALEQLPSGAAAALLREVDPMPATAVIARVEGELAARCVEELGADAAPILAGMPPGAVAALLRRVPAATTEAILAACPVDVAAAVRAVISHPRRTVGALMDPQAPSLLRDGTAGVALTRIREHPDRFKHYAYVVDREGALVGVIRLVDLVAAPAEVRIDDLMRTPVVRLQAEDVEVAALAHPGWDRYASLPVVDRDQRLVGVIRDDVVRAVRRDAHAGQTEPVSLALAFAELLWLGVAGVTEGVANVVGREIARSEIGTAAPSPPEPKP